MAAHTRIICVSLFIFLFSVPLASSSEDEYIDEAQKSCTKGKDPLSCVKYKALKYVAGMADNFMWAEPAEGGNRSSRLLKDEDERFIKLVNIKNPEKLDMDGGWFFGSYRQLEQDSELEKIIKFGKRQLQYFMMSHGISVGLPAGARAVTDDDQTSLEESSRSDGLDYGKGAHSRGKKKKLSILFPLLSLLATMKIKVLLIPILISVLFIKKILVLAALFLPTLLSSLKVCKMNMPSHGHHTAYSGGEISADYGGYGGSYSGYSQGGNTGYGKDWAAGRAYNAHKIAMERKNSRVIPVHPQSIPDLENDSNYSVHQA